MPTSTDTLPPPPAGRGHRHERTLSSLEKDLNAGYRAWQRGDTARAVELLQSVLERRPGAPEAAFPAYAAMRDALNATGKCAHSA